MRERVSAVHMCALALLVPCGEAFLVLARITRGAVYERTVYVYNVVLISGADC